MNQIKLELKKDVHINQIYIGVAVYGSFVAFACLIQESIYIALLGPICIIFICWILSKLDSKHDFSKIALNDKYLLIQKSNFSGSKVTSQKYLLNKEYKSLQYLLRFRTGANFRK